MTFISYAQNFEDVLLRRALKWVRGGFYIDVGAQHPDIDSVTRAFYDQGWSGINVEPVPEPARRLREARPRDLTLQLALGADEGEATLFVVGGTGLSSLDAGASRKAEAHGFVAEERRTPVSTLAAICREHVRGPIHFLKIDVEGAEAAVLAGADFARFRPWIVLVEAIAPLSNEPCHEAWEAGLLAAGYEFAWFDGLNRFYVAAEHADALLPLLSLPPNVADDFIRAADVEWARRIGAAEAQAEALGRRVSEAERWRRASEEAAERAHLRLAAETARRAGAERRAERQEERAIAAEQRAEREARAAAEADALRTALAKERQEAETAKDWVAAMQASSSWRVTKPLREVGSLATRARGRPGIAPPLRPAAPPQEAPPPPPAVQPVCPPAPAAPVPARPLRTVHQFHSGSATSDAITNAMLLTQRKLREMGFRSDIFVEHRDPALAGQLRLLDEVPAHADYVLMMHVSMGSTSFERMLALPVPKVLCYHDITPPEHLPPSLADHARLGREQLRLLVGRAYAALADSDTTAIELRKLGFDPVTACPLLFDVDDLLATPRALKAPDDPFTVLFVGRIVESKGQRDLVEAFAEFNRAWAAPARLVLVGRDGAPGEPYLASVHEAMHRNNVRGQVHLAGPVSDAELRDWYARADLYVSLSRHEGFGVPLVEAMARGVPVLAWPAGAVAETLGEAGALLSSPMPTAVADEMLRLARDRGQMEALAERGRQRVARFKLDRQLPKLAAALARAGAAFPADPAARANLRRPLHYTVTGHINGSYSLAAVNTALALALEAERPGRVRIIPVEGGEPSGDLGGVGPHCRATVARLAGRPAPDSGVEVVISQHYPAHAPAPPGDVPLALFFWEESLVPAETVTSLNQAFRGVLAPSRFVAKALRDSGVYVPVRILPQAPALHAFEALGRERGPRPPHGPFTFLHVSSCFPRKGVDVLLAAYARAFRAGDDVQLVIKGFPNIHNEVPAQLAALDQSDPGHAPIRYVDEDLSAAALVQLYREADTVVLPSRGEGYNLPAAEAMAAGVPLIATGYGGHLDFCGPDEARLLRWRFAPSNSHLATAGSAWVEPCVDDLTAALREAFDDPAAAQDRAARARARIAREASAARTADALDDAAVDLLLAPPRPPVRLAWLSSWDVRCGVAEYARSLLDALPRDGIGDIVVLSDDRTAPDGAGVRALPVWRQGTATESLQAMAAALGREDPDVVVLQHQPGLLLWEGLVALLRHPALASPRCVLTLHNTAHLLERSEEERAAVAAALAGVDRVLVHTIADLNRLAELGLLENVALLPQGAAPARPARPTRQLGRDDEVLIGSYGFFLPRKGLPELVQALALLRARWPNARLRLVNADYGGSGSTSEIATCRQLAAEAGLGEAVEFCTDFLPNERSLDLLGDCDLVVLPYQSSTEASSASVRTALAAGVPVAVTPLPLFEEAEAATARLPGIAPAAIADGIAALLADTPTRSRLTEQAGPWLAARSWERVGARLANIIRGLARGA